jgi:hypothetical protein
MHGPGGNTDDNHHKVDKAYEPPIKIAKLAILFTDKFAMFTFQFAMIL